jgi:hypothetical protein
MTPARASSKDGQLRRDVLKQTKDLEERADTSCTEYFNARISLRGS